MTKQKLIVEEARSWIGTKFHHQGRLKKNGNDRGGCDCIGLIIGVCANLNISINDNALNEVSKNDYSMEPNGLLLKNKLDQYLDRVNLSNISIGDILLFRFNRDPQHLGIISDYTNGGFGLIHCYAQAKGVVEHVLDDNWRNKIVSAYRLD